ncbi:MAG: metal-dependent hydrolase [Methylobacterium sp.]|jgi:predicted metal-dependent hydrolase|nr:metal-dependent hydrolase [Methylobacterium sp.]
MTPDRKASLLPPPPARLDAQQVDSWHGGSAVRSDLLNALSLFLPAGERFFVRAVAENLTVEAEAKVHGVEIFLKQESNHARMHEYYNSLVVAQTPSAPRILGHMDAWWRIVRAITSPRDRLAVTAGIEHITTLLSRIILGSPQILAEADDSYASVWRWHALEEIEHKSVAFDLYFAVGGDAPTLRRTLRLVGVVFVLQFAWVYGCMLADRRLLWRRETWNELRKLWATEQRRAALTEFRAFFRPGFSPRHLDDGPLLAGAVRQANVDLPGEGGEA